ncbi:MAG: DUF2784 domain-containing protein [Actinomycetota bacterium]|nr:DUF2784 domain-containing protein [Actinomycetota bacterium]
MLYRSLAHLVVVAHVAFMVFVGVGALLAWRSPRLVGLHLPALLWGVGTITVGLSCPLTAVEKHLRRLAGAEDYRGGFVDHYVEGVLYPAGLTPLLWALAAACVVAGYAGLLSKASAGWGR